MAYTTVEYLFPEIIKFGLGILKENPNYVDFVFRTHEQRVIDNTKSLIANVNIPTYFSYPETRFSVPCFVLFLEGEEEVMQFLDDSIQDGPDFKRINPKEVEDEELKFTYFPKFALENFPIQSVELLRNDEVIPETDYRVNTYLGSGVLLGEYSEDDTYIANYTYFENYAEKKCSGFNSTYRIEILSNNAEEVICLYRVLQYLFMVNRSELSYMGLKNQRLYGSDMEQLELKTQPEPLYKRVLYISFLLEGAGVIPLDVLKSIEVRVSEGGN